MVPHSAKSGGPAAEQTATGHAVNLQRFSDRLTALTSVLSPGAAGYPLGAASHDGGPSPRQTGGRSPSPDER
jgi:hypothetical protein